jgi:hypothetical protein
MELRFNVSWPTSGDDLAGKDIVSVDLPWLHVDDVVIAKVRELLIELYDADEVTLLAEAGG